MELLISELISRFKRVPIARIRSALRILRDAGLTKLKLNVKRKRMEAELIKLLKKAAGISPNDFNALPDFYRSAVSRAARKKSPVVRAILKKKAAESKTRKPRWATTDRAPTINTRLVEGCKCTYQGYSSVYVGPSSTYPGLHNIYVDYQRAGFESAELATVAENLIKS